MLSLIAIKYANFPSEYIPAIVVPFVVVVTITTVAAICIVRWVSERVE